MKNLQKTITLKHPLNGRETLTMRRPQVVDARVAHSTSDDPFEVTLALFQNLCGLAPDEFDTLLGPDLTKMDAAYSDLVEFEPVKNYTAGTPIKLAIPLVLRNGTKVEALKMREATAKELKAAHRYATDNIGKDCYLFAAMAGVELEDFFALDYAEFRKLKSIYGDFLS